MSLGSQETNKQPPPTIVLLLQDKILKMFVQLLTLFFFLESHQLFRQQQTFLRVQFLLKLCIYLRLQGWKFAKSNFLAFASKAVHLAMFHSSCVFLWASQISHSVISALRAYTSTPDGQVINSLVLWLLRCAVYIATSGLKYLFPRSISFSQFSAESFFRNHPWQKWFNFPRS